MTPRRGQRKPSIDEGLDALIAEVRPGVMLSQTDIARRCQCKQACISLIELRAMRKIRKWFAPMLKELCS